MGRKVGEGIERRGGGRKEGGVLKQIWDGLEGVGGMGWIGIGSR